MPDHYEQTVELQGVTWDHSRGYTSIVAVSQRFEELNPGIRIRWEKRSLSEFESEPIDRLARHYDLLIIDHPWAGFAVRHDILLNLNELLDKRFLSGQARNSVGTSFESYSFNGFQSALPIDAASPVAVWRPDLLKEGGVPRTFEETMAMAREGKVIYAAQPTYLLMDFLSLCVTLGGTPFAPVHEERLVERQVAERALDDMHALANSCDPIVFTLNPISLCELLASSNKFQFCPAVYGYVNYSRRGYAPHPLKAGPIIKYCGKPLRGVLGGTGIAISAGCEHRSTSARFLEYVMSGKVQRTLYCDSGGQPGHRSAWRDPECNRQTLDFFQDTLPTLDNAYLRPRYSGYLTFQDSAGKVLFEFVRGSFSKEHAIQELNRLFAESTKIGG